MDVLSFSIHQPSDIIFTRRGLLSKLASVFDPLGQAAPVTVQVKIKLKIFGLGGLHWGAEILKVEKSWWEDWLHRLPNLNRTRKRRNPHLIAAAHLHRSLREGIRRRRLLTKCLPGRASRDTPPDGENQTCPEKDALSCERIEGNEMADQLANSVHGAANRVPPTLRTANELSRPLKLAWLKQLQDQLQLPNSPQSLSRAFRTWFFHRHRRVSIVLHRLRNGHNRLKCHTSRFQTFREDIDGSFRDRFCRFGCPALENACHVIIECPNFNPSRAPLKRFFQFNNLDFGFISVSGQNPAIPVYLQFKIRDNFVKFLTNSDILSYCPPVYLIH